MGIADSLSPERPSLTACIGEPFSAPGGVTTPNGRLITAMYRRAKVN
jgi:hypothetical protein